MSMEHTRLCSNNKCCFANQSAPVSGKCDEMRAEGTAKCRKISFFYCPRLAPEVTCEASVAGGAPESCKMIWNYLLKIIV